MCVGTDHAALEQGTGQLVRVCFVLYHVGPWG